MNMNYFFELCFYFSGGFTLAILFDKIRRLNREKYMDLYVKDYGWVRAPREGEKGL